MSIAHRFKDKTRTDDVLISESVDFSGLLLSNHILQGLTEAGFKRPSPIQLKAIPLGRCGLDLIVQAKSGTGKTCVFTVVALESLQLQSVCVQVLILAPTREIALQIEEVIHTIGKPMKGLKCHTFIGGLPVHVDKTLAKSCHIAVGTPGRVKQLIEIGVLKTSSIRLFIMDEADKLLEGDFQKSINWIYSTLPENKQILALSATYPEQLAQLLTSYMRNPTFVRLNVTDPALLGIKQYHVVVPNHPMPNIVFSNKTEAVVKILSSVSFQQCLIFSNLQTRAQNLQSELQSKNWPTACIAGYLDQKERNLAMEQLKTYKCRILISTDLTSRGIDADKVNLVINLDVPPDHETYLHRIGRAGRFGSFGAAVTIVTKGGQDAELWAVERKCGTYIHKLPDPIPNDLVTKPLPLRIDDIVSTEQIINKPDQEIGATFGASAHNAFSQCQKIFSSSVSDVVSEVSEQEIISHDERTMADGAENVESTRKDTSSAEEVHIELPKIDQLSLSDTPVFDTEPVAAEGSSCELGSLLPYEAAGGLYGETDTDFRQTSMENPDYCKHKHSTDSHDNSQHESSPKSLQKNLPKHADSALTLSVGDSKTNSYIEDSALTISVGDSKTNSYIEDSALPLSVGDSKTNSCIEYAETSEVEIENTTLKSSTNVSVSQFNESTRDTDRKLESCLETGCKVHVDIAIHVVQSMDVGPFQYNTGNISPENSDPKINHQKSSRIVSGSLCNEHESMLCNKGSVKDVDNICQTVDISECNKSSCSDSASSDCTVISMHHGTISREISSEDVPVSDCLNIYPESVGGGDMVSDNVQLVYCGSESKESDVGVACNSQSSVKATTSQEKVKSLFTATGAETVRNGDNLLNILDPPVTASVGTDNYSKSCGDIPQATNKSLTQEGVLNKSHAEPRRRGRRGHLRSFAVSDFLHCLNEGISSLNSMKIGNSVNGADENSDEDHVTSISADLDKTSPDPLLCDVKGGGDCMDVSYSLSLSRSHLECGAIPAVDHLRLKAVGGGDCSSFDLARESFELASNVEPDDVFETCVTNKEVEILNVCCSKLISGNHGEFDGGHHEDNQSSHENVVDDAATATKNQPVINVASETVLNILHSSTLKDFSRPTKVLAEYLSSQYLNSQNHNQLFMFANLEADHLKFRGFDSKLVEISCSRLMTKLTMEDFVDSKAIQAMCAFENEKLVALKSRFQNKLLEVVKAKSLIEVQQKSRNDREGIQQKYSRDTDMLHAGKAGEKSLPQTKQGPKGKSKAVREKKLKGSDSLNWRNEIVEVDHGIREKHADKVRELSLREEARKWCQEKNSSLSEKVHQETSNRDLTEVDQEFNSTNTSVGRTGSPKMEPAVLNQSEQNREGRALNEIHDNMLEKNRGKETDKLRKDNTKFANVRTKDVEQDSGTEKLRRQDNTKFANVITEDIILNTDVAGQEHLTHSQHKDDECKLLDDMHAQMLMRRKERKLRMLNLSSDVKLPVLETVSGIQTDHEAEPDISVQTIKIVCTELADNVTGQGQFTENVVSEQLPDKHLRNVHRLVMGIRSTQHDSEESKQNNQTSTQERHPRDKKLGESQVIKDHSKSITVMKKKYKQNKAESGMQSKYLSNSQASQRRPTKPSKLEAKHAGLEVISTGSTSSTSDLSLSSASDLSDVNSSDLDNKDMILASQCYANKYAHEGYVDSKDGRPRCKKEMARKMLRNSSKCHQSKHGKLLQESATRPGSDYFQHYDVSGRRVYSTHNLVAAAPSRCPLSTLFPADIQPFYNQHLQHYAVTELPSSIQSNFKDAKRRTKQQKCEPGSYFQNTSGSHSQEQNHRRGASEKHRTRIHAKSHYCENQSLQNNFEYSSRRIQQTDESRVSESEGEYSIDDPTVYTCHCLHRYSQHQPCPCSSRHLYSHDAVSWLPNPYSGLPQSVWNTQPHYGAPPPSFYNPQTQLPPYPYPAFYHNNHLSQQSHDLHPMFQYQAHLSEAMWNYVSHMTKMMSYLSRKHRRAAVSGRK